jgi:histidinol-phosphate aminotransferase
MPDARCNRRGVGPVPNTGACTFPPSCVCLEFAVLLRPMTTPRYTDLVLSLPATVPFVGPETQERARGAAFAARLGANESVFGPSPRAVAAISEAASDAWMYGDPELYELRIALARHHGVTMENIVVGEGIDGLLGYLVRLLVAEGDAVVTSDGAYPTFNYHVAGYGGVLHKVPYTGDHEDPQALVAKAREVDAKLVYFANPDNPMGSWHDAATVQAMIDALPEGAVLALDEAYCDTAPDGAIPPLDLDHPRMIRFRTFSKAYGLAGLRVGYGLAAPDFVAAFNRIRNHFGVGRVAQAGALAALADQGHLMRVVGDIATARLRIGEIARDNGLTPLPSATNFVTVDCGGDGDFARAVLSGLVARGIFVRMPFTPPQDRCIRVSCGPAPALDAFAAALPQALADARKI